LENRNLEFFAAITTDGPFYASAPLRFYKKRGEELNTDFVDFTTGKIVESGLLIARKPSLGRGWG
jgi:hypothetical protein